MVAHETAIMHNAATRFRVRSAAGARRYDADHFFPADFSAALSERDHKLLGRLEQRVRDAMRELGESRRRFGVIHGDLGPDNWVFFRTDPRPIDFEELGVGHFLFDLVQVLWTHLMWPDYDQHLARLLAAYERVRPLDDVERRHLRLFETLPLVDWMTRTLRANDTAALNRWLAPTLKCMRDRATDKSPAVGPASTLSGRPRVAARRS